MELLNSTWRKSTASGNTGSCVMVRRIGEMIEVGNTRNPQGTTLTFTADEWEAFLAGAKLNEFEV